MIRQLYGATRIFDANDPRRVEEFCRAKNIVDAYYHPWNVSRDARTAEWWYLKRRSAIYSVDDGLACVSRSISSISLAAVPLSGQPPTVSHVWAGCSIVGQRMLAGRRNRMSFARRKREIKRGVMWDNEERGGGWRQASEPVNTSREGRKRSA